MLTRDTFPGFIENIRKELVATSKSLPKCGTVEAHLGEDEEHHFGVECSLATNLPINFDVKPVNEEKAEEQVH